MPTTVGEVVLLQRRGEDLGRRGGVAVDQDDDRAAARSRRRWPRSRWSPWVRLSVETTVAVLEEDARRTAPPRSSRPPPLPRRSSTRPSAPCAVEPLDLVAKLAVGALAEGREARRRRSCCRRRRSILPVTAGTRRRRARASTLPAPRRSPASTTVSSTSVPAGPLIRAVDDVGGDAGDRLAVDGDDQVAVLDPGLLGRGVRRRRCATRRPCFASVTVSADRRRSSPEVVGLEAAAGWSGSK